jgi:hypothetical protein
MCMLIVIQMMSQTIIAWPGSCHSGSRCVVKLFFSDTQDITTRPPTPSGTFMECMHPDLMCHIMHVSDNCDPNVDTNYGCFASQLPFWFIVCREAVLQRHAKHNNQAAYYFWNFHCVHAPRSHVPHNAREC